MSVFQLRMFIKILKKTIRTFSSNSTLKQLGYSKNTKLLIIHADDLGLSESQNAASILAFEKGIVNSGSIMVNCPKFTEMVDYSMNHPKADLGLHLTLTSEWNSYKWGPVLPANEVASLVDESGFFFESREDLYNCFIESEVENELRAQINLALNSGIGITHIDSHMCSAINNPRIQKIYVDLGKEYKLPVFLTLESSTQYSRRQKGPFVDRMYIASLEHFSSGLENYYSSILKSIKPGLNCILLHIAFNNKEMRDITQNEINYGALWRQSDFDFFTSDNCKLLINKHNIQLITWQEIKEKLIR